MKRILFAIIACLFFATISYAGRPSAPPPAWERGGDGFGNKQISYDGNNDGTAAVTIVDDGSGDLNIEGSLSASSANLDTLATENGVVGEYVDNVSSLLLYAPFRTDLKFSTGSGIATFSGGDNGTIIDCDGVVHSIPENVPRFFGARYENGKYYATDGNGDRIPYSIDEVYPNGGAAIGDSQTDNTYSYSIILGRKLGFSDGVDNFGSGGDDLANIKANLLANGLDSEYDFYIIQGGINDIVGAVADPNSEMQATMKEIIGVVVGQGIRPILIGISPWDANVNWNADRQTWTDTYNTWLESYCSTHGYFFVDTFDLLEDPSDADTMHSDYDSGDGLHWNDAADAAIGEVIYYELKPNFLSGLLIEGDVENLALYSEDANQADWSKTNITRAAETATAPDGASTVDKLTASAANGTMLQTVTASENTFTFSCWLKRDTGTGWIDMTVDGGTTWERVYVVDSWQRFDVTKASVTNPEFGIRIQTNTDAVLFWGGQLETGKYPKSYVPTTTAAVTKAAETVSVPYTSNINSEVGTAIVQFQKEGTYLERDTTNDLGILDTGGTNFRLAYSGGNLYFYKYGSADNHLLSLSNIPVIDRFTGIRLGLTWGSGGVGYVFDQDFVTASGTDADGDAETDYNDISADIYVGSRSTGYQINSFIQGLWIYSTELTQAQIEGAKRGM